VFNGRLGFETRSTARPIASMVCPGLWRMRKTEKQLHYVLSEWSFQAFCHTQLSTAFNGVNYLLIVSVFAAFAGNLNLNEQSKENG
jgi:hypothetical protein